MALSLCTNPVVFLGGTAGCAFVSSLMRRLLRWAQSSELSAFDCPFDSNGRSSVCLFESNGRLLSFCSSAFAICPLGSQELCASEYPFHLIRYCNWRLYRLEFSISSTSHSGWPSISSGAGSGKLRPCSLVS